jgi:hypothetical protein
MPSRDAYPRTVAECLSDRMTFKPEALRAMRAFRASHPWQGSDSERFAKLQALHTALAHAYGIEPPALVRGTRAGADSGASHYIPSRHQIVMCGPDLSVITYLHEFGHARGYGERGACRFSLNLFRRVFPRAFARLRPVGHTLIRSR